MKRIELNLKAARSYFVNRRNPIINNDSKPNTVCINILGGLGNQLFQIASAYSYARKNNGNLVIPYIKKSGNRQVYWDTLLKNLEKYLVNNFNTSGMDRFEEDCPTEYKDIGTLSIKGKFLNGYFQTSKYFYNDEIKDEIKSLFRPDSSFFDSIRDKYSDILDEKVIDRVIVIHSRRTDYLKFPEYHNPLDGDYYKRAVQSILEKVENPIFLLCGDDNSFWRQIQNDIPQVFQNHHIILNENDILTFTLLQQFKNFIISNSTFIWWCVWLSKDTKNVIAPSRWFGPKGPKRYSDIYEPSWILK